MLTCESCGLTFERSGKRGPVPKFCSHRCRQRAYCARRSPLLYIPREDEYAYDRETTTLTVMHADADDNGAVPCRLTFKFRAKSVPPQSYWVVLTQETIDRHWERV